MGKTRDKDELFGKRRSGAKDAQERPARQGDPLQTTAAHSPVFDMSDVVLAVQVQTVFWGRRCFGADGVLGADGVRILIPDELNLEWKRTVGSKLFVKGTDDRKEDGLCLEEGTR